MPTLNDEPIPPFYGAEFVDALSDYEEHRKEKRSKLTRIARKRLYMRLKEWGEARATAALIYSTSQGWVGVFEEKNGNGQAQVSKADSSLAAARRVAARYE